MEADPLQKLRRLVAIQWPHRHDTFSVRMVLRSLLRSRHQYSLSSRFVWEATRFHGKFNRAGMEKEADAIADLLDRFTGFCGPHAKLGDAKQAQDSDPETGWLKEKE